MKRRSRRRPGNAAKLSSEEIAESNPVVEEPAWGAPVLTGMSWAVIFLVSFSVLFVGCFWELLFLNRNVWFRDVGHFYHPLFQLIQQIWSEGKLPLWNPYENCGSPIIAQSTSSVFYPLKLIFFLPLAFDTNFKMFILIHFVIAAVGVLRLCRTLEQSWLAAFVAALSFAFSQGYMFQYCNLPFLCSAAWLPFGIEIGYRLVNEPKMSRVVGLAAILAIMVLCGDPQMGYHIGMLLFSLVVIKTWKREGRDTESEGKSNRPRFVRLTAVLLFAACLAGGLSAIQILPTMQFSRNIVRSESDVPRNVWQVPGFFRSSNELVPRPDTGKPPNWYDAILSDPPPPAKHDLQIYSFSILPFRVSEFMLPNPGGRRIGNQPRFWTWLGENHIQLWSPSIYFGLLPFLLAVTGLVNWRSSQVRIWLTFSAVIFLLGSFGEFGIGWLWNEQDSLRGRLASRVGSVYWFFVVFLPAYDIFRFPAKLWIISNLSFSILAGFALDDVFCNEKNRRRLLVLVQFSMVVGLVGTVVTGLGALLTSPESVVQEVNVGQVWWDLFYSFLQLLTVSSIAWFLFVRKLEILEQKAWYRALAILLLVAVDLTVANGWSVRSAPIASWQNEPLLKKLADELPQRPEFAQMPTRLHVMEFIPSPQGDQHEHHRMAIINNKLFSMLNLPWKIQKIVNPTATMKDARRAVYFDSLPFPGENITVQPRRAYDLWGSQAFVVGNWPENSELAQGQGNDLSNVGLQRKWDDVAFDPSNPIATVMPRGEYLPLALDSAELVGIGPFEARVNTDVVPPVRILRNVEMRPQISRQDRKDWMPIMTSVVFPVEKFRDLRKVAIVEDPEIPVDTPAEIRSLSPNEKTEDSISVQEYDYDRMVVQADLGAPGLLVVAETFDEDWTVDVQTDDNPAVAGQVLRTNFAMRGVLLDKGSHRLEFRYQPNAFWRGCWISIAAILLTIVLLIIGWRKS